MSEGDFGFIEEIIRDHAGVLGVTGALGANRQRDSQLSQLEAAAETQAARLEFEKTRALQQDQKAESEKALRQQLVRLASQLWNITNPWHKGQLKGTQITGELAGRIAHYRLNLSIVAHEADVIFSDLADLQEVQRQKDNIQDFENEVFAKGDLAEDPYAFAETFVRWRIDLDVIFKRLVELQNASRHITNSSEYRKTSQQLREANELIDKDWRELKSVFRDDWACGYQSSHWLNEYWEFFNDLFRSDEINVDYEFTGRESLALIDSFFADSIESVNKSLVAGKDRIEKLTEEQTSAAQEYSLKARRQRSSYNYEKAKELVLALKDSSQLTEPNQDRIREIEFNLQCYEKTAKKITLGACILGLLAISIPIYVGIANEERRFERMAVEAKSKQEELRAKQEELRLEQEAEKILAKKAEREREILEKARREAIEAGNNLAKARREKENAQANQEKVALEVEKIERDKKLEVERAQRKTELKNELDSGSFGKVVEVWISPESKISLCYIPPGSFDMGSPEDEPGRDPDEKLHRVTLTKGFWMSKYELTCENWDATAMGGDRGYGSGAEPARVSWDDAKSFITGLSGSSILPSGWAFALPTEAQWEYACRAGSTGPFAGDLEEMAWWRTDFTLVHEVGLKKPNKAGLYDMHGNVSEWVEDPYREYPPGAVTDPAPRHFPRDYDAIYSYRGGSVESPPKNCRSAARDGIVGRFSGGVGIRLVVIHVL